MAGAGYKWLQIHQFGATKYRILTNFDNSGHQVNVHTFKLSSQLVNVNVQRTFNSHANPSFAAGGGDLVVMKDINSPLVSARLRVGFSAGANLDINYSKSECSHHWPWWSMVIRFVQLMIHIHSLAHLRLLLSMLYRWQGGRKSSLNFPWPSYYILSAWSWRPPARFYTSRHGLPMYTDIVYSLVNIGQSSTLSRRWALNFSLLIFKHTSPESQYPANALCIHIPCHYHN